MFKNLDLFTVPSNIDYYKRCFWMENTKPSVIEEGK